MFEGKAAFSITGALGLEEGSIRKRRSRDDDVTDINSPLTPPSSDPPFNGPEFDVGAGLPDCEQSADTAGSINAVGRLSVGASIASIGVDVQKPVISIDENWDAVFTMDASWPDGSVVTGGGTAAYVGIQGTIGIEIKYSYE